MDLDKLFVAEHHEQRISIKTQDSNDVRISLMASRAATTDYDLTGQIVWPVAVLLSHYLVSVPGKEHLKNSRVVELGAGCGLVGMASAMCSSVKQVVWTDGNESIVDGLLKDNCEMARVQQKEKIPPGNDDDNSQAPLLNVAPLLWGDRDHLKAVQEVLIDECCDVVVAADVVQWPAVVEPLLHTVTALLWKTRETSVFLLGIVSRAQSTYDLFFSLANEMGFTFRKILPLEFLAGGILPDSCQEYGGRQTEIYELKLKAEGSMFPLLLMPQKDDQHDTTLGRGYQKMAFLPC